MKAEYKLKVRPLQVNSIRTSAFKTLPVAHFSTEPETNNENQKRNEKSKENLPPLHKVFVFNLPYKVSWQELKDLAKNNQLNPVYAHIAKNREDNKSRGFGSIQFKSQEEAEKCIEVLNGMELEGRTIGVRKDQRQN